MFNLLENQFEAEGACGKSEIAETPQACSAEETQHPPAESETLKRKSLLLFQFI